MLRTSSVVIVMLFFLALACGEEVPRLTGEQADIGVLLSGDVRDKFMELPPAFREALASYVWHGVSPDVVPLAVKDKIEQWGDAPLPLAEMLGEERAERFRLIEPSSVQHGHLLLSYYVYVLNTEPSVESRVKLMQEAADIMAPPPPGDRVVQLGPNYRPIRPRSLMPEVPVPSLDSVLTKTALARIDRLGPSLREGLRDVGSISSSGETGIHNLTLFLTSYEMFALKAEPGLDVPSIEVVLTREALSAFRALSQERRDRAEEMFLRGTVSTYVGYVATTRRPVESASISVTLAEVLSDYAAHVVEFQTLTGWPSPRENRVVGAVLTASVSEIALAVPAAGAFGTARVPGRFRRSAKSHDRVITGNGKAA